MDNFEEKEAIFDLILSNKKGVSIENIIDYLDYVNKIRYSEAEVNQFLEELKLEKKVTLKNQLWYALK